MSRARPYDRQTAIDAAMTLFWEKGYHATSLKDLEAALQMKPGSIYAAFKSKEGLYLEALAYYGESFEQRLDAVAEVSDTPLKTLANFMRSQVKADEKGVLRACMVVKTLLDLPLADGPIGAAARAQYDHTRSAFADLFRAAQAQGQLAADADPEVLAKSYQMAITSLRIEAQRTPNDPLVTELAETQAAEIEALAV